MSKRKIEFKEGDSIKILNYVKDLHKIHFHFSTGKTKSKPWIFCQVARLKYDIIMSINERAEKEQWLKVVANKISTCENCKKYYLNYLLSASIFFACSTDMIRWLLENGANPNVGAYLYQATTIITVAAISKFLPQPLNLRLEIKLDPKIFYWLVIYGGEILIHPNYVVENPSDIRTSLKFTNIVEILP